MPGSLKGSYRIWSDKTDWATPVDFFKKWDDIYHFTLDVCANKDNFKCERYFTLEEDGLKQDWSKDICWCNPPYGFGCRPWVEKSFNEAKRGATVVLLLPSKTDSSWFHDFILPFAQIHFIRGRLTFIGAKSTATFCSIVAVFSPKILNCLFPQTLQTSQTPEIPKTLEDSSSSSSLFSSSSLSSSHDDQNKPNFDIQYTPDPYHLQLQRYGLDTVSRR